jgi:hypothetical protein
MEEKIAVSAVVDRDVPVGSAHGVWVLTLYTENGEVVVEDSRVLPTQERSFEPLDEAAAVLRERGYLVSNWINVEGDRWNGDVERFGPKEVVRVHFIEGDVHLSGSVEAYGIPEYVQLAVGEYYPFWVRLSEMGSRGSADAHYREFHGVEFPGDAPVCTDAR